MISRGHAHFSIVTSLHDAVVITQVLNPPTQGEGAATRSRFDYSKMHRGDET